MPATALTGGFADPARDAAHAFRPLMRAMARPGTTEPISGAEAPGLSPAAATVLATLCDPDTPVFLAPSCDSPALRDWISFQTGAPLTEPAEAQFALGRWEELPLDLLPIGNSEYPDRSATVIVECDSLSTNATPATLKGPGIKDSHSFPLPELAAFQRNRMLFPLGLDFLFTSGSSLAALPRSTEVS